MDIPSYSRTFNVKALAWLVGSLAVLAGSMLTVHAFQVQRNAGIFKRQAQQAEQAMRYDEAVKYYRLYLGYVRSDVDTRLALAGVLDKKTDKTLRDQKQIIEIYEGALRLKPENHAVRLKLVDAEMALLRFADALQHIELLLNVPALEAGKLEQQKALCLAAMNENDKAVIVYQKAIQDAPGHLASYVQLAGLYGRMEIPAEADKIMEKLVKENANNHEAHLARARHLEKRGAAAEAAREIEKASALAGDAADTLLAMAGLAQSKKRFDEARAFLQRGLERYKENPAFYLALASVEMSAGQPDEAAACLRAGLPAVPVQSRNLLHRELALCLIQAGKMDQVEPIIATLERARAPAAVTGELRARLRIAEGNWIEATAILERIQHYVAGDATASAQENLLLGLCYEKLGEPDRALAAFRQALADNVQLLRARIGAAAALFALGRLDESLHEYQAILPEEPSVGINVAKLLVLRNLRLAAAKPDWEEVEKILAQAERDTPQSTELPVIRAQSLMARKQPQQARAALERACREHPQGIELWLALADTAELQGNVQEGLAVLKKAEGTVGDRIELRLARARFLTRHLALADKELGAALAKLETNAAHFNADERARLLRGLGEIHYRSGNHQEARRLWTQVAAAQPRDLQVRLALFDLAIQAGDQQVLNILVKEIRDIEGAEGTFWRYGKASTILASASKGHKEDLRYARKLLSEVAAKRSTWAPTLRGLAVLDELEGNHAEAMKRFAQAFDLGDRDPDTLRRAIQLMYDRQQFDDADRLLKKLEEQGSLPAELLSVQAALRSQQGQHEHAIALARKAVQDGSQNPRDHLWLGQILRAGGPKYQAEALDAFGKAARQPSAGQYPEVWIALVQFLADTRQTGAAGAVIAEAKRKLVPEQAAAALGACYEVIGEFEKAGDYFEEVVRKKPADLDALRNVASFYLRRRQLSRAEPYLLRLLDPGLKVTENDRFWARCFLAICRASAGDYHNFQAARGLLERAAGSRGGAADDQRLLALLLATHPHTRREAIRLLEDLHNRATPTPEDQFALGQLYEAVGDWLKAREIFGNLATAELNSSAKTVRYIHAYVLALTRQGRAEEAANWLAELVKRDPETLQTVDAQVRVLKLQGRLPDALELLRKYVQKPAADLQAAAQLLEDLGQPRAAEELYRKLATDPKQSRARLVLADFLGRQGRVEEALDLCEQAAKTDLLGQAVGIGVAVLQSAAQPMDAQFERVDKLLGAALGKYPDAPALLARLATLRNLQGKYAEAEAAYRGILERDKQNITALNNLAFLLAYQEDKSAEALSLINRALDQAGKLPELLDTRALVYLKLGSAAAALQDLDAAIYDTPSAPMYFHRAQAQRHMDRNAALASLRKAQELKLARASLHPLEQPAYDELVKSLGVN